MHNKKQSWRYVYDLRRGVSHIKQDKEGQDSVIAETYTIENSDERLYVVTLSDGIGQHKYSKLASEKLVTIGQAWFEYYGANISEQSDINAVKKELYSFLSEGLGDIQRKIHTNYGTDELSTGTFSFLMINTEKGIAFLGGKGDSAVSVFKADGSSYAVASSRNSGGIVSDMYMDKQGITNLDECAEEMAAEIIPLKDVKGFIVASDSFVDEIYSDESFKTRKNAENYLNAVVEDESGSKLIDLVSQYAQSGKPNSDDDISIAVLVNTDEKFNLKEDATWLCVCGERNPAGNNYCSKRGCHKSCSSIYGTILRENKGKLSREEFFASLNADPEKEQAIANRFKAPVKKEEKKPNPFTEKPSRDKNEPKPATYVPDDDTYTSTDDIEFMKNNFDRLYSKHKETKDGMLILSWMLVVSILISSFSFILLFFTSAKINKLEKQHLEIAEALKTEEKQPENVLTAEDIENSALKEEYTVIRLEDNTVYIGEVNNNIPDGKGILVDDKEYYIGDFIEGKKNGKFYVLDTNAGKGKVQNYENGEAVIVPPDMTVTP